MRPTEITLGAWYVVRHPPRSRFFRSGERVRVREDRGDGFPMVVSRSGRCGHLSAWRLADPSVAVTGDHEG